MNKSILEVVHESANPHISPMDAMIAEDFCRQRAPEPAPYLIRGPKA